MYYSVRYRYPGQWFYRTIKRVKADGIIEDGAQSRYFITDDESRVELPTICEFVFSSRRFEAIKSTLESKVGQNIPVNTDS